jgi:hypothetical protein
MSKFNECEQCTYNNTNNCALASGMHCRIVEDKLRIDELNLSKNYLNSDYYWKRLKELLYETS